MHKDFQSLYGGRFEAIIIPSKRLVMLMKSFTAFSTDPNNNHHTLQVLNRTVGTATGCWRVEGYIGHVVLMSG